MAIAVSNDEMFRNLVREGVQGVLAKHIESRLISVGARLVRGKPEAVAKGIVRAWSDERCLAFVVLRDAGKEDGFTTKAKLSKRCGWSRASLESFWTTLRGYAPKAIRHDGAEVSVRLFRRGHELFHSADGVMLKTAGHFPSFEAGKRITETTAEAKIAADANYEGGCIAQERDESKSEEERTAARSRIAEEPPVVGPQVAMFRTGTTGK